MIKDAVSVMCIFVFLFCLSNTSIPFASQQSSHRTTIWTSWFEAGLITSRNLRLREKWWTMGLVWEHSNSQKCVADPQDRPPEQSSPRWMTVYFYFFFFFLLDLPHVLGAMLLQKHLSAFSLPHCNGLSNTESGRMEIFSFFSGQLYSLGNFDWTKGKGQ